MTELLWWQLFALLGWTVAFVLMWPLPSYYAAKQRVTRRFYKTVEKSKRK